MSLRKRATSPGCWAGLMVAVVLAWAAAVAADSAPVAVRGLSPGEVDDLREGRGMGLARAAEVNGYPGPRHVLDAARAGRLALPPEQLAALERVLGRMSADARRLGERILADEQALETAFRTGSITERELHERLALLASLRAELREVHLRAHLETRRLLDEAQVQAYQELGGDNAGGAAPPHHHP